MRGINNIAPKPRKVLQLLRLLQMNNGVFIKVNKATTQMLQLVEPYVTYGEPNLKSQSLSSSSICCILICPILSHSAIRELVYKRGYGKVNRQRLPLSDNQIVEANLGKFGIVSVEDMIHEIHTAGPNFKQVASFLWPFKLSNPNGGYKSVHFNALFFSLRC